MLEPATKEELAKTILQIFQETRSVIWFWVSLKAELQKRKMEYSLVDLMNALGELEKQGKIKIGIYPGDDGDDIVGGEFVIIAGPGTIS